MTWKARPACYSFSIERLVAKYTHERSVRDIFLEGYSDVGVIRRFAQDHGLHKVTAYSIETVNIPAKFIQDEVGSGNRGRVVALAHELSRQIPKKNKNVMCIADNDFDHAFGKNRECDRLWLTDYSCMEAYLFDQTGFEVAYENFLSVAFIKSEFSALVEISVATFGIRCARATLDPSLGWIDITRSVEVKGDKVTFDQEDFFNRLLNSQGRADLKERFKAELERHAAQAEASDPRHRMHKDDVMILLGWTARRRGATKGHCAPEVLASLFMSHLTSDRLKHYPLFQQLLAWASAAD